jgi:hypothetical protein
LLRATAADVAELLQKAVKGSQFTTQASGTAIPSTGIIFTYDSTITDNQLCKVTGNGTSFLRFTAAEDNGLVFGIYQYLDELGFKFYQPGTIWEVIPSLSSAFKTVNKEYNTPYKYKSWFISGGHRNWVMDKSAAYNWETYSGENGHNWALYQRRNGMLGANRFAGHRGDIINGDYLTTIQNNPCYVASYDGSRKAGSSSVPDINNNAAMQLWANSIEQKYTQGKDNILRYPVLYVNQYRNLNYTNQYIGIEVPDGPRWGNSRDSIGCNNIDYVSEADQSMLLANYTVSKIKAAHPGKRFQMYGYFSHANIPSPGISIDPSIDVQVVPTAFQSETSAKGLLNRWYERHSSVSEYHYLNIPQWSGETPMVNLNVLKQTVQRLQEKKSQGIIWEASPAKFASLPYLKAANESLIKGISIDSSLREFCNDMFGPAALTVYELLQQWSADGAVTAGYFTKDNRYKIPLYLQLLQEAVSQTPDTEVAVRQRLNELKAYLHYATLYYDWFYDARTIDLKVDKAVALCTYLAKINKMQLVNSYYLITGIVNQFGAGSNFYTSFNVQNGTAYQNGALPLITPAEIEADYQHDISIVALVIPRYRLQTEQEVSSKIPGANLIPAAKINVNIGFTNGANYSYRTGFSIYAKSAGSFSIKYTAQFSMPGKGYINFTVENAGKALAIIKDTSLTVSARDGVINVDLPEAGYYYLSLVSKYQSSVQLEINTKGNVFYKNNTFTHRYAEKYTKDLLSLPGYFYVPGGLEKVFFSVNNSYIVNKGHLTAEDVNKEFAFRDCYGKNVTAIAAGSSDPTLFYITIPAGQGGNFWQISKMGQFFICFANISNMLWYGQLKTCTPSEFKVSLIKTGDECLTKLITTSSSSFLSWEIEDGGTILKYDQLKEVVLPPGISPNAIVTLKVAENCFVSRKLSDLPDYVKQKAACASGAAISEPAVSPKPVFFPNPSTGQYIINMHIPDGMAERVIIADMLGRRMAIFYNVSGINISHLPAGNYSYQLLSGKESYRGQLIKL